MAIEKIKILGAVLEPTSTANLAHLAQYLIFFSIAIDADYSYEMKNSAPIFLA